MDPRWHVEFYLGRRGIYAGEFAPATVNWVGRREMCVGGLRPSCRELHEDELHTRPKRAGQAKAEVFLAADPSAPRGGGSSGLPHHGVGGAARPVELVRTQLVVALDARTRDDDSGMRRRLSMSKTPWIGNSEAKHLSDVSARSPPVTKQKQPREAGAR